jgi:hypothetical protein
MLCGLDLAFVIVWMLLKLSVGMSTLILIGAALAALFTADISAMWLLLWAIDQ